MFCFKKSKKMLGTWMVQKMEIPSVHKIAKIFGKCEFESSIFKKLFFSQRMFLFQHWLSFSPLHIGVLQQFATLTILIE